MGPVKHYLRRKCELPLPSITFWGAHQTPPGSPPNFTLLKRIPKVWPLLSCDFGPESRQPHILADFARCADKAPCENSSISALLHKAAEGRTVSIVSSVLESATQGTHEHNGLQEFNFVMVY